MRRIACGRARVVSAPGHRFMDIGAPVPALMDCLSLINFASLRAVEAAMGRRLDPLRFRANICMDGSHTFGHADPGVYLRLAGSGSVGLGNHIEPVWEY